MPGTRLLVCVGLLLAGCNGEEVVQDGSALQLALSTDRGASRYYGCVRRTGRAAFGTLHRLSLMAPKGPPHELGLVSEAGITIVAQQVFDGRTAIRVRGSGALSVDQLLVLRRCA